MENKIIINEKDNIGVCLTACGEIPAGHKYALKDIKKGEKVIKYGEVIGRAKEDIKEGDWVHTHNVKSHLDETPEYSYNFSAEKVEKRTQTFMGYKRANGRAGIRNEIYIIPTVGCVNNEARIV
jgi:altronate hydrolase